MRSCADLSRTENGWLNGIARRGHDGKRVGEFLRRRPPVEDRQQVFRVRLLARMPCFVLDVHGQELHRTGSHVIAIRPVTVQMRMVDLRTRSAVSHSGSRRASM